MDVVIPVTENDEEKIALLCYSLKNFLLLDLDSRLIFVCSPEINENIHRKILELDKFNPIIRDSNLILNSYDNCNKEMIKLHSYKFVHTDFYLVIDNAILVKEFNPKSLLFGKRAAIQVEANFEHKMYDIAKTYLNRIVRTNIFMNSDPCVFNFFKISKLIEEYNNLSNAIRAGATAMSLYYIYILEEGKNINIHTFGLISHNIKSDHSNQPSYFLPFINYESTNIKRIKNYNIQKGIIDIDFSDTRKKYEYNIPELVDKEENIMNNHDEYIPSKYTLIVTILIFIIVVAFLFLFLLGMNKNGRGRGNNSPSS